ncbi:hypothetical protein ACFU96_04110 [Streptomyces sp. NPDC057620]
MIAVEDGGEAVAGLFGGVLGIDEEFRIRSWFALPITLVTSVDGQRAVL